MIPAPINWHAFNDALSSGNALAAMELTRAPAPSPPPTQGPSMEDRITALEQLVQRVAAPAMDAAAQAGVSIMSALGKAMSADQAAWVQARLETSPEFFTTPDCHVVVDLLIDTWRSFEERKP